MPFLDYTYTKYFDIFGLKPSYMVFNPIKLNKILFKGTNFLKGCRKAARLKGGLLSILSNPTFPTKAYTLYTDKALFKQYVSVLTKSKLFFTKNKLGKRKGSLPKGLAIYKKKNQPVKADPHFNYCKSMYLLYKHVGTKYSSLHNKKFNKFINLKINKFIIDKKLTNL
jgi:hypothetical protein